MSLLNVFDIAGTALSAQSIRLNVTASNLANVNSVGGSPETTYRARQPLFKPVYEKFMQTGADAIGVRVSDIVESKAALTREYRPDHPAADEHGYVYVSNVNAIEEMTNMIAASRAYQNNIEVINASKEMLLRTLSLGQ